MKYTTLLLLLVSATLSAQPTLEWSRTFGGSYYEECESVCPTPDGGVILAGSTYSTDGDIFGNHGGGDVWVLKLNAQGNVQWKRLYGGSDSDIPSDIIQTSDGGYIVVGYTASNDHDVSGLHGEVDGWVFKISGTGNLLWQRAVGGSLRDYFEAVAETPDGGFILTGNSKSSDGDLTENFGDIDLWIVKLDNAGALEWQRSLGGSHQDFGKSVIAHSDGSYTIGGETQSVDGHITFNHGNVDCWVIKMSENGDVEWHNTYGGEYAEGVRRIKQTLDGGYVFVAFGGSVNSGQVMGNGDKGYIDFWVVKLDAQGNLVWQRPLGGTDTDLGRDIIELADGSYVAAGASRSSDVDVSDTFIGQDMWVIKLSSAGDLLWQKAIGGSGTDSGFSVGMLSDGSLVLCGYSWSTDGDLSGQLNRGKSDIWAVKLAPETVSATADPLANGLLFYPNPAKDWVSINASGVATLRDMSGRLLHTSTLPPGGLLDIRALSAGTYQVEVQAAGGRERYFGKLVVGR